MDREEKIRHKEEMFAFIEKSLNSGLSNKVYCKQKGMSESSFYYWQKKYREEKDPGGFIPIRINRIEELLPDKWEKQSPAKDNQ